MEFNYRELIKKYMAHVGWCEGIDFIDSYGNSGCLTDEEFAELQKLSKESHEDVMAGRIKEGR